MKFGRVKASEIDMDEPLTMDGQLQNFERRLVRLWQIGILPSRLSKALNVSLLQVCEELDRLDVKLGGLKLDAKTALEYGVQASKSERTRKTKEELQLVDKDLVWLHSLDGLITRNEMARYFGVQEESLAHHQRRNSVSMQKLSESERDARNQLVIDEYLQAVENGEMKGIVTKLSNRHDISRKMVDLILGDHKVNTRQSTKRNQNAEIQEKHKKIVAAYNERIDSAVSQNALVKELAVEFGYKSHAGILKVIRTHAN